MKKTQNRSRKTRPEQVGTLVVALALALSACAEADDATVMDEDVMDEDMASPGMNEGAMGEMTADAPRVPPVFGYYSDEEVFFIHTEVSDPDIATTLEGMMGSPVPVVESLAQTPPGARSAVYVFANGIVPDDTPSGPLGFAPDVFDTAPGDEAYTPLRELMLVTWVDEAQAEVLTSEQDVLDADSAGEVTIEDTGIVVNMPLLTWPGGSR